MITRLICRSWLMRKKARQALEARTVDKVNPGEQQPETDHRMETDDSNKGNTEVSSSVMQRMAIISAI